MTDPVALRTPTAELSEEHGPVLQVVTAMEREAARIRAGAPVSGDAVSRMVDFTREFTDGCHHAKEEKALFPRMLAASDRAYSPVAAMLEEHIAGRTYVRAIAEALPAAWAGDRRASLRMAAGLEGYTALLRVHIRKEDEGVFPLAERVLDARAKADLAAEFERIEREETGAGMHEKYHAVAEELDRLAA